MENTKNLKKGVLEILMLSLLNESDMYGYQIVKELDSRSNGEFFTTPGSLYPLLYRFGAEGYITEYQKVVGKRRIRIYYHLEDAGRAYLKSLLVEYKRVSMSIETILNSNSNK